MADALPIIGRERALIDKLTQRLHADVRRYYDYGAVCSRARGSVFEVRMDDGRIARVTIELDRVEPHG